ncbi:hypothetical protein niasHS_002254 [Heterodera schachtii]|uniref:Uncharacterized protein n=1 Tax=Heterodera schachtii TaxID=97005 RepID=A0ABD2KMN9_HETSC
MVVIASRNVLAGVPEGGASAVMRSEVPAPHALGRSRSLADVFRSNSRYAESKFSTTVVPIGMPSKPISVHRPYWIYSAYWPYRYHRNFNTYDNQITDSFYWHYPFRLWTSYKHNWYQYDSPYYYRRYHDNYNIFYNTELMSYGNRSKLMENLYQGTPITQ